MVHSVEFVTLFQINQKTQPDLHHSIVKTSWRVCEKEREINQQYN